MTLLFLTGKLTGSATGYCVVAVAEELAKRGHIVHIVSAYLKLKDRTECEGHLYIHEIPGHWIKRKISQFQESGRSIERFLSKVIVLTQKVLIQIKGTFTIVPLFNDVKNLYYCASQILENNIVDVIIPVVNPRESIKVAGLLFSKYKVPYVPYYLDSIYGNIGLRVLPGRLYKIMALRYEDKWLSDAKSIIMMQSVKRIYEKESIVKHSYVSKIIYLDLPLLSIINEADLKKSKNIFDNQFIILFIGTMPNRIRDPRYVFRLADNIAKNDVHFYFAGKSDYMNDLNHLIEKNHNVHFLGMIKHDDILNFVEGADVLLNIGNSIPGMLPSKVFEYMSYQKPILSTIKHSDDLSVSYLKQYGAVQIVDETQPLKVSIDAIQCFIQKVKSGMFIINVSDLVKKDGTLYSNTPDCFCEKVESIMSL